MQTERIHFQGNRHEDRGRSTRYYAHTGTTRSVPLDAITLDKVELSGERIRTDDYNWLISHIQEILEAEVVDRMKKFRNSSETIDDALIDKLIMEIL